MQNDTATYWSTSASSYLLGDLAGHLLRKVPVLTDSVEELAALHHLHDDQESGSDSNGGANYRFIRSLLVD